MAFDTINPPQTSPPTAASRARRWRFRRACLIRGPKVVPTWRHKPVGPRNQGPPPQYVPPRRPVHLASESDRVDVAIVLALVQRPEAPRRAAHRLVAHDPLVFLEIQGASLLIMEPGKVSTLNQRYARIRAQALDPRESLGLIERLAGDQQ
ncbi:Scr1 family TA system antitoxin-like transcriptional regulator [Streptomyces sp. NPDC023998]|uniref:Scr1 family TA system antitoxin-like transcriptional regulator n=1 Tax=Streptomyces sp. NPDC023998 TaxID=3154597 RepID=UPI0033D3650B